MEDAALSPAVTALIVLLIAFITGALLLGWIRAERDDRARRAEAMQLAVERADTVFERFADQPDHAIHHHPGQWALEVRAQYVAARAEQIRAAIHHQLR